MARLITCVILFGTIVLSVLFSSTVICHQEENLQEAAEELLVAVEQKNWEKINKLSETLTQLWKETENFLKFVVRHHSLDEIGGSVARMKAYAKQRVENDLTAELYYLRSLLYHVREGEEILIFSKE